MSNKLQIFNSDGTAFYDIVLESYTYSHTTMSLDASIDGSFVSDLDLRDKFKHTEYVLYKDVKYYLIADVTSTRDSAFSNKDKGLFRYTVKFNAPMIELQRMFMYDPQTGQRSYAFYGDVKRLTDDIEYNLVGNWKLVYQPNFIPSTEVPDEPISFDGATVADALNKLYSEKNVPFTVEGYTIYIGTPVTEVGHTFKYSKEGGLKTEPTTPKNNSICTQVYPIGSTQNIPYPYPKIYDSEGEYARVYNRRKADGSLTSVSVFKTHLMPSIYRETLQAHVDNGYDADNYPVVDYYTADDNYVNPFNPELPLPLEVANEDIKPTIEGATYNGEPIDELADVSYYENDNDVVNTETGEVEVSMFKITLPPMGFDVYAQAAVTGAMTIAMKSGDTIGASYAIQVSDDDFKASFYDIVDGIATFNPNKANRDTDKFPDSTNQSITIDVLKDIDTFGVLVPQEYRRPSAGDKFVLLNIEMPLSYVTQAEGDLSEYGKEWMRDNNEYLREYPIKFDEALFHHNPTIANQITTNALIPYEIGGVLRKMPIQKITIKYYDEAIPTYDLTLTDEITISQNAVASNTQKLQEQAYEIKQNETKNADRVRHNSYLTQKTLDGLFDAEGGNRIDNVEANVGYFNGLFVGQNPNDFGLSDVSQTLDTTSAQFSGGTLTHFWADAPFENKEWTIAPSDIIQLDDTKQYYLYIQANRVNNSAIWVISPEQKLYNEDGNVWFFNAGQIIYYGGFWSFIRTYGITTQIGATISTEIIKSHNYENTAEAFTGMMIDFLNARIYMGQGAEIVTNQITFKSANGAEGVKVFTEEGLIDANSIDVDNLIARKIRTSESGERIESIGNTMDVYDSSGVDVTTVSAEKFDSYDNMLDTSNVPVPTALALPETAVIDALGNYSMNTGMIKPKRTYLIEVGRINIPEGAGVVDFSLPPIKIDWTTRYEYTNPAQHTEARLYSGAGVRYELSGAGNLNVDDSAGSGYESGNLQTPVFEMSGEAEMGGGSKGRATHGELVINIRVLFADYDNILYFGDECYNTALITFANSEDTDITFSKQLTRTHLFGNGVGVMETSTRFAGMLIGTDDPIIFANDNGFLLELWQYVSGTNPDGSTWWYRKSNLGCITQGGRYGQGVGSDTQPITYAHPMVQIDGAFASPNSTFDTYGTWWDAMIEGEPTLTGFTVARRRGDTAIVLGDTQAFSWWITGRWK